MKRKLSAIALGLILALVIVSCDGGYTGIMKFMGKNVLGNDESQVSAAVSSVEVSAENKTESSDAKSKTYGEGESIITLDEGKTITYKNSEGEEKELFTVGKAGENQVIAIGDFAIELDSSVKTNVASIEAVLPPLDLTNVLETLDSTGKDALVSKLAEPISDDDTKKAVEGTVTLVQALMEMVNKDDDSSSETEKDESSSSEIEKEIKKVTESLSKTDELTMGDVVVLRALTNVIADAGKEVVDSVDKASKGEDINTKEVIKSVSTKATDAITVIDGVAESTKAFEGMNLSAILQKFM